VTNRIYVAGGTSASVVTVIDGASRSTTVVPAGFVPVAVAVNETTNKIYVANIGRTYLLERQGKGSVTVIDGATNATATVIDPNAHGPCAIAVNPATNKIYVANDLSSNVTVIDGATNATTTVTDPNASRLAAYALAVNPVSNKVYVANQNIAFPTGSDPGNITVIDGGTNATTTVTDPNAFAPTAVAVNTLTNKIYVSNRGAYPDANHGNVTILDGATNSTSTVTDPNAVAPGALAVSQATNKIYVADANGGSGKGVVSIIDGATNSVVTLMNLVAPLSDAVAVDEGTNRVYVVGAGCENCGDPGSNPGGITVIDGDTDAVTTVVDPKAVAPAAVGLNPVTNQIYVPNRYTPNLTVVDGAGTATMHVLEVLLPVGGIGTVTSDPSGINCGTVCAESFSVGAKVSLTAAVSPGASFLGWSGACVGTGSCNVTMSSDQVVTATFSQMATEVGVPNAGGDSPSSGGSGGGDALTPAALLSVLVVSLRRRKALQILQ